MKKKILSIMLVGAMVASMGAMAGCGSSDSSSSSSDTTTTDDGSAAAETEEDSSTTSVEGTETLTVWCWDASFNIPAIEEATRIYKEEVNENFGIEIVETLSDDCETLLTTAGEAGDFSTLPDIVLMQDNSYQKFVYLYPEAFTDLTDSGIDFSNFPDSKVAYSTVDGKNYGVPFDNGTVVGAYRIDILEECGYTIEDLEDITWDEFITIGTDIYEQTGMAMISSQADSPDLILEMLQSAGASLFNEDGTANLVGNSALEECINYYIEMKEAGVLLEVNSWDDYVSSITTSQVVGTINGCWICATIMSVEDFSGLWDITNMPSLTETAGATNYSNNGGSSWYITANCSDVDLAVDFLSYTFAGSVELYENILPSTAAIATYIPAGDSDVYSEPQEFWNDEAIYAQIVEYSSHVPSNNTSAMYYDVRGYVGTAITNIVNGSDYETEIEDAQSQSDFAGENLGL
ncbi:MAG: extracellular solute-binding protein [Clostridiales bacterium]|nr:extracellular solute-binding protein [Clostridiales bacterium]